MQIPPLSPLGLTCLLVLILTSVLAIASTCLGEYFRHVRWHDLRVRCHRMRRERLMAVLEHQAQQEALAAEQTVPVIRRNRSDDDDAADEASETTGVAGRIEPSESASPARRAA